MYSVQDIVLILENLAPVQLAETWDNVGLLVGDRGKPVERVMTCLTITPASCQEAIEQRAQMIVTHHPLPFHPLVRITSDTTEGQLLLQLIEAGIAVYSAHSAYDSARAGINQHLATKLELLHIEPIVPLNRSPEMSEAVDVGSGRMGTFAQAMPLADLAHSLKSIFSLASIRVVGNATQPISKVGIACGSGGSLLEAAIVAGCDGFITGETNFHTCLAAESQKVALVLMGHFASEHFALSLLAEYLDAQLPHAHVWASKLEHDPIKVL